VKTVMLSQSLLLSSKEGSLPSPGVRRGYSLSLLRGLFFLERVSNCMLDNFFASSYFFLTLCLLPLLSGYASRERASACSFRLLVCALTGDGSHLLFPLCFSLFPVPVEVSSLLPFSFALRLRPMLQRVFSFYLSSLSFG